ncbi:hypothetical protein [Mesorhizobium sp.]|uniref:hypothetical protein n=1 Tax=Mesorhizobium sp. TaxID=1871066 RepID=UPI0025F7632F|nr:hypothetical protein [Mesorhizobium sp.]
MPEGQYPFYNSIVGLGATMGRVGGDFISARYYSGIADEHLNTHKNVGVSFRPQTFTIDRSLPLLRHPRAKQERSDVAETLGSMP